MIKFFRNIREALLNQNRFGKYLLYAIGEILLVVIGIFIALSLNNWNDNRKQEAKAKVIFKDILEEINNDLKKINEFSSKNHTKDSVIFRILNGMVTREDYEADPQSSLFKVTIFYSDVTVTRNAYDHLLETMGEIPESLTPALEMLDDLYSNYYPNILNGNEFMLELSKDNITYRTENYDWFSATDEDHLNQQIDYYLNSPRYKNKVRQYQLYGIQNHFRFAFRYRQKALDAYREIAQILGEDPLPPVLELYPDSKWIGDFTVDGIQGLIVTAYEKEGRFFIKNNGDENTYEYFWYEENQLVTEELEFITLTYENGDTLYKSHQRTYRGLAE